LKKQKLKDLMPKKAPENSLLAALQFVASVQPKRAINAFDVHCRMFGGKLVAMGGPLSAGIAIQEEIEACPNTQKLIDALKKCPEAVNLTMITNNELSVRSGNFQATVPCINQVDIPSIFPNLHPVSITMEFELSLRRVGEVVSERAKTVLQSSVQLRGGSIVGSNGDVILEAWHGLQLPDGPIVPKLFISAINKQRGKSLYSLGIDGDSLTAYFPDGSWIKTALQRDLNFPDLPAYLTLPSNPIPLPLGFFEAIERLAPFSRNGRLYFTDEGICTDNYTKDGAINLCEGLPIGISFTIESLQLLAGLIDKIDFNVSKRLVYFFGPNVRGCVGCERL
jgi:hypothetical protein